MSTTSIAGRLGPAPVLALVAGLLLLPATPAHAASGITSPGAGEVVTAEALVPLRAVVEGPTTEPSELSLQGPDAAEPEIVAVQASPDGGELSHDFDTSCARQPCNGRVPAPNGTWTLRLSGEASDERTFVLRIPPAVPDEVSAVLSEGGVRVRWRLGPEPDLTGYAVHDASGAVVRDGIRPQDCDAERRCSVEVPEQGRAWTVRAFRSTCPGCAEVLGSRRSAAVKAGRASGLPTDPETPDVVPGSGSPSPAAGSGKPSGPSQGAAFSRVFGTGRPGAVPPPASNPQPRHPMADGPYDVELGYGEPDPVLTTSRPPVSRAQDAVVSALGSVQRLALIGLSVLTIGGAVWLRRWARRAIAD